MDITENRRLQAEVSKDIMKTWDACPESGEPTAMQIDEMYVKAHRLAELVIAAHQWESRQ